MAVNVLFKNKEFDGVRFAYGRYAFPSGTLVDINYTEGRGDRYYYSVLSESDPSRMEAADFQSFISVTMSGAVTHFINMVPLEPGETVSFDIKVHAVNSDVSKGFIANPKGGFRHDGTDIKIIGGGSASLTYDIRTDFSTVNVGFIINSNVSVALGIVGQASEVLDWDIFVNYKKGFHSISSPPPPGPPPPPPPIYPDFPTS